MRSSNRPWIACLALLCACTAGAVTHTRTPEPRCLGGRFVLGDEPELLVLDDCAASDRRCEEGVGCIGCTPGATRCDGASVSRCGDDGATWDVDATCAATEVCRYGACEDACALAEHESSYEGCVYDAVTTLNSLLQSQFPFGIVLGNASEVPAEVRITRAGDEVARVTVPPRSARQVELPFVEEVSRADRGSSRVPDGAYHIEASRPVAAYQYNPLEFRRDPSCVYTGTQDDRDCFSFTNDASLLLPVAALGTEYLVTTPPLQGPLPTSFVTIVAHAPTHLSVLPQADITASEDGAVEVHPSGARFETDLAAGEVLTFVALEGSLEATEIESDVPVMVVAGCNCANVPAAFGACDHLEEIMLPVSSWGTTAVAAAPRSVSDEPSMLRILSASDHNEIEITGLHRAIALDRGESFEMVTTADVVIAGTGRLVVTQFLVGAQYFDRGLGSALGDPAMGVAPFAEQFRTSYGFAAPDTYTSNFAAIVTTDPETVRLDGAPIAAWDAIDTSYFVARVPISGGAHFLDAQAGAGLTLYGLAPYTSYLLPGGLDVEPLR